MTSEYVMNSSNPYLEAWTSSTDHFICTPDKYILICERNWRRVQYNLHNPIEEGSSNVTSFGIGIGLCIFAIAGLIFYIVKLKKKLRALEACNETELALTHVQKENY